MLDRAAAIAAGRRSLQHLRHVEQVRRVEIIARDVIRCAAAVGHCTQSNPTSRHVWPVLTFLGVRAATMPAPRGAGMRRTLTDPQWPVTLVGTVCTCEVGIQRHFG